MAFSDELIRTVVAAGRFSDAGAERHLADVLINAATGSAGHI
jgi:hypothetical protein